MRAVGTAQAAVLAEGEALWDPAVQRRANAWLAGRAGNLQRYKPGSGEALLLFSDRAGGRVLRFPLFWRLRAALEPVLEQARSPALLKCSPCPSAGLQIRCCCAAMCPCRMRRMRRLGDSGQDCVQQKADEKKGKEPVQVHDGGRVRARRCWAAPTWAS
jgi:hypothetical protein